MNLELKRYSHKGESTCGEPVESIDGHLFIDGQYHCDTAENTTTALPAGQYIIIRHFCHQYNRFVPLIVKCKASSENEKGNPSPSPNCGSCEKLRFVSNNTTLPLMCPQFCPGNGIHNRTDGTIQVGTRIIPGCLKNPREPYENLMERIRKISGRGNEVTLTII